MISLRAAAGAWFGKKRSGGMSLVPAAQARNTKNVAEPTYEFSLYRSNGIVPNKVDAIGHVEDIPDEAANDDCVRIPAGGNDHGRSG
jgi:hypothetical protein